ncbi:hypothetical protein TCAL_04202 [Tigriopus californicus]|uniref:Uncharacterized protein n=1 Tax=Tigriopus californicus TaxID=6832 RepID=A0A553N9M0_TIGCA|nr:hypothetical protein TCAL_04202 [Tigriopus californicus]
MTKEERWWEWQLLSMARPIGCRMKRVECMEIKMHQGAQNKKGFTRTFGKMQDLQDFSNPTSDFALVKSCLHLATNFSLTQGTLEDLLAKHFEGGIEVETWSDLPEGTGLGTSSILAGTILACLWDCMGLVFTIDDIIHGVLQVEQLLTTGGGWQDQVNGLVPGIKIGRCLPKEPLTVTREIIPMEHPFNKVLESHLVLVYTGKVRLAKNLLQNVVKAWYSKKDVIHQAIRDNHDLATKMWTAIQNESLAQVGECLNTYWTLKKLLAEGSEPESIVPILKATKSLSLGQSLAGAGGGGFLVLITKAPNALDQVQAAVEHLGVTCHQAGVDLEGLTLVRDQCDVKKTFH